jgi:ketosteroid isomerase-like protein
MNINVIKAKRNIFQVSVLLFSFFTFLMKAEAQPAIDPNTKEIIRVMNNSANEWNEGKLDAFVDLYDPTATMMMPTGPVGMSGIKDLYQKKYFKGKMPKQNLRYSDLKVRFLGSDYALLTGAFTLYGNNLPERSGRYSLVMIHAKNGWKILHDHSS